MRPIAWCEACEIVHKLGGTPHAGSARPRAVVSIELDLIRRTLTETIALHERVRQADARPVLDAAAAIVESLRGGGKLLVFGNGGSAADAQHVAADLVGRFLR